MCTCGKKYKTFKGLKKHQENCVIYWRTKIVKLREILVEIIEEEYMED